MTLLDSNATMDLSHRLNRDEALKVREHLRGILRTFEDAHRLPRSFETKAERVQRETDERRLIHHE